MEQEFDLLDHPLTILLRTHVLEKVAALLGSGCVEQFFATFLAPERFEQLSDPYEMKR